MLRRCLKVAPVTTRQPLTLSISRPQRRMASTEAAPAPEPQRVAEIGENIKSIREQIAQACSSSAKESASPTLVLVSKLKPPSDIIAACEHCTDDQKHFGENYVQEVLGIFYSSCNASPCNASP